MPAYLKALAALAFVMNTVIVEGISSAMNPTGPECKTCEVFDK